MPVVFEIANEAMRRDMELIDSVSRNVANAQTEGFKREMAVAESYRSEVAAGATRSMLQLYSDLSPGVQRDTGRGLDLALSSSGFFVVEGEDGERMYTRRGHFQVDSDGRLLLAGRPALGEGGAVYLDAGPVAVASDGALSQDGISVGRLLVVDLLEPGQVNHAGEGFFAASGGAELRDPADVVITSGRLEGSNVEMMEEVLGMMEASRRFESSSKVMQAYDALLETTINELADF